MLRNVLILVVLLSFFNCKEKESQISKTESAEDIIKESIEVAGGDLFDRSDINFDFRDMHYRAIRNHGRFQLERHFKDSLSEIKDVLSNSGFERLRDEEKVHLSDSLTSLYSNSVNSVHYFSVLPYGLDGKAVHKIYLGSKEIKGKDYHKIKITFSEDGGGEDFEDEFIYWIAKDSFSVDYLAYSFKELDGGMGFRFREAYNIRMSSGLRFADYNNYKPTTSDVNLENLDDLFIADKLQLLSKIELKNFEVNLLN
ncbi:DUF6503 family protein [Gelidibacter gilvus]|uniref:DUF6503 family protein n=1 Tax=Gelidibacter gilvus TaxID=59602 RepID=UPI001CB93486|nr:DUF6503 family protein [Gelidibacter gilvus]